MPAVLIDKGYLAKRIGATDRLERLAQEDDANITQAIAFATEEIRSAVTRHFTSESFDALTVETTPQNMKFHAASIALWSLASNGGGGDEVFQSAFEEAKIYKKLLASGAIQDADPLVPAGSSIGGAGRIRGRGPKARAFDRDGNSDYAIRFPKL